jgi:hypothetical protein
VNQENAVSGLRERLGALSVAGIHMDPVGAVKHDHGGAVLGAEPERLDADPATAAIEFEACQSSSP